MVVNYEFIKFLGADVGSVNDIYPEWWFEGAQQNGSPFIQHLASDSKYVLLAPFASQSFKEVYNEDLVRTVQKYAGSHHLVISGVTSDRLKAERLKRALDSPGRQVINLCGQSSLSELVNLIRHAEHVITVDTGILHFAIALNKVSYAIVGGGHWGRFYPWGIPEKTHWLNNKMECFRCNWICKYGDHRCVKNLNL